MKIGMKILVRDNLQVIDAMEEVEAYDLIKRFVSGALEPVVSRVTQTLPNAQDPIVRLWHWAIRSSEIQGMHTFTISEGPTTHGIPGAGPLPQGVSGMQQGVR